MYFTVYLGSSGVSMYHYASHYMKCCSNSLLRQHVFVRAYQKQKKEIEEDGDQGGKQGAIATK